jgi:glycosyltransferase involved in cell wall biosynthesis
METTRLESVAEQAQAPASEKKPWRAIFVSWGKLRRADTIAGLLGIPSYSIRHLYRGCREIASLWTLCRYVLQTLHTIFVCLRHLPRVVFVTHPPLFAAMPVALYSFLFRARYVMDFHSGCFIHPYWRRWDRVQRFFARRAALNLVHNADNARVMDEWGAPYEILPSLPPELTCSAPPPGRARPLAVYICSFKEDEPVKAFLEAAGTLPEVDFKVTGRAPEALRATLPPNVELTGFLSEEIYNDLLSQADLIVALTTRSGTLLYGAQEAIALHKPLVLSRTETLTAYFAEGTVFAENTPDGLREAVGGALARKGELAGQMAAFEKRYREEGRARLERIRARLCGQDR